MLYVLEGNKTKTRARLDTLLKTLLAKKPDAEIFEYVPETLKDDKLKELIESRGLFNDKYIVVLKNLLEEKAFNKYLIEQLSSIKESPNIFFLVEEKISAPILKQLKKHAETIETHKDSAVKGTGKDYSIFSITNALEGGPLKSWVEYQKALRRGVDPNETLGILFWFFKNLNIVQKNTLSESGLQPFVYKKAKGALQKISFPKKTMSKILNIYHERNDVEERVEEILLDIK